jgi:hypothetical protein
MKNSGGITFHLVLFILFLAGIIAIADEARSLYTMTKNNQDEKEEVVAEGKIISSDLFGNMEYYAVLEAGAESNVTHMTEDKALTDITQEEFNQLDTGDTIEIEKIDSSGNNTYRSEMHKSILLMVVYAIGPAYYISYLILRSRIKVWKWLSRPIILLIPIAFFGFLAFALIFGYISMGKMLSNAIQSYTGAQFTTEAIVTDSNDDFNGGRYPSQYYYLAFTYNDPGGNTIHMTKEVRPSVYNNSRDTVTISFPVDNPYRIHTKGFSASDIIFYGTKLVLHVIVIALTALLLYACITFGNFKTWMHRIRKQKQSREQSRRDKKVHRLKKKSKQKYDRLHRKKAK